MERGNIAGKMEEYMKGCISTIKNTDLAFINEQMEEPLQVAGKITNSMVMEHIHNQFPDKNHLYNQQEPCCVENMDLYKP